jgi:hypothetical protein
VLEGIEREAARDWKLEEHVVAHFAASPKAGRHWTRRSSHSF